MLSLRLELVLTKARIEIRIYMHVEAEIKQMLQIHIQLKK